MLEYVKQILTGQFGAALAMLNQCTSDKVRLTCHAN
jgi:hypothetical protein